MTKALPAPERVQRLLAIIPYVAGRGPVPIDEIAQRFSYPRVNLIADLTDVVSFVGVAPFTPDTMIDVIVEDEYVQIDYGKWFERPMRLAPAEALSLFAAGRAVLDAGRVTDVATDGDEDDDNGPLLRGLTKLGAAIGAGADAPVDVVLGSAEDRWLQILRTAVNEQRCVELDYYSYGRDVRTERVIEPQRFFADDGQWYVGAWCRAAQGERVFRVDRIHHATLLDETFAPRTHAAVAVVDPLAATERATIDLAPDAAWVVHHYPNERVETLDNGWQRVTLPVTASAWLERLLVRLGSSAHLVDPMTKPGDAPAAVAARRILARYQASSPHDPAGTELHKGPAA